MKPLLFIVCASLLLLLAGCARQPAAAPAVPAPAPPISPPSAIAAPSATPPPGAAQPPAPSAPQPQPPAPTKVSVSNIAPLGDILTDDTGMTLYVSTQDEINKPTCYGVCAAQWRPFLAPSGMVNGTLSGRLGTVARADGSLQVTYNGMPLYRWFGDKKPGDATSQGLNGVWWAAQPNMTGFPRPMTLGEAMAIAANSDCAPAGNLTNRSVYDNNTQTWSIGVDTSQSRCVITCQVYGQNKSAGLTENCPPPPAPAIVHVYNNPAFGEILTDGNGMTLYIFLNDRDGLPTCYDRCASVWPPLISTNGQVTGAGTGRLGTVARADGSLQATYNGMPLYRYAYDAAPGMTNGNGYNNTWSVVLPDLGTFPPVPVHSRGGGGY